MLLRLFRGDDSETEDSRSEAELQLPLLEYSGKTGQQLSTVALLGLRLSHSTKLFRLLPNDDFLFGMLGVGELSLLEHDSWLQQFSRGTSFAGTSLGSESSTRFEGRAQSIELSFSGVAPAHEQLSVMLEQVMT